MNVLKDKQNLSEGRSTAPATWYADWQNEEHVRLFDRRATLKDRDLVRNFESFNDVRILGNSLDRSRPLTLLEVGCATGEFHRYIRIKYPRVNYIGVDISRTAIARARQKYPEACFFASDPTLRISEELKAVGIPERPEVVYSKDVLHHQTDPFGFLSQLLEVASEVLILRTRTRDLGQTVLDPERSCQRHYDGWVPYMVMNLQELIDRIQNQVPGGAMLVYRNHMILGGQENRFLPKECYLPETGTAETSIGVFLRSENPGRINVEDRRDLFPGYPFIDRIKDSIQQIVGRHR